MQLKSFPMKVGVLDSTQPRKHLQNLKKHRVEKIRAMVFDLMEMRDKMVKR
jgi:hypothetical protein